MAVNFPPASVLVRAGLVVASDTSTVASAMAAARGVRHGAGEPIIGRRVDRNAQKHGKYCKSHRASTDAALWPELTPLSVLPLTTGRRAARAQAAFSNRTLRKDEPQNCGQVWNRGAEAGSGR